MALKTSITDPLQIGEVGVPGGGKIGLTFCPGKCQPNSMHGHWQRDLALDLDLVKAWGAVAVVTLMPMEELLAVKAGHIGEEVEARGMEWHHLPITDVDVPDPTFETLWALSGLRLRMHLLAGRKVLVHCRGGLGRTGTVAGRLMAEMGVDPRVAVDEVRRVRPGAIQTKAQLNHVLGTTPQEADAYLDRLLGCLLGGALGDAFGYAVEFDKLEQIKAVHGPHGIREPVYRDGQLLVSDDTQMTLFTLEGLLRGVGALGIEDMDKAEYEVHLAYRIWHDTQSGETFAQGIKGKLGFDPRMRQRRAPGNTCISVLGCWTHGTPDKPINDSKGCGAVMRAAPVGLVPTHLGEAIILGSRISALTHGHQEGWLSGAAMAGIVAELMAGRPLAVAVREVIGAMEPPVAYLPLVEQRSSTIDLMRLATGDVAKKLRHAPEKACRALGEGWVGDEALAIGLYAALTGKDFPDVVARAANHDGDSDSTASIAGQLWGAWKGSHGLPFAWLRRLDVLLPALDLARAAAAQWNVKTPPTEALQGTGSVAECQRAILRQFELAHELHLRGYQHLRAFPSIGPVGAWRLEMAPARCFRSALDPVDYRQDHLAVRYTSASVWDWYGWGDVSGLAVAELADRFEGAFPEVCRLSVGEDWAYAGWLCTVIRHVRQGLLPYMMSEYFPGLDRGVPLFSLQDKATEAGYLPLPPPLPSHREALGPVVAEVHASNPEPDAGPAPEPPCLDEVPLNSFVIADEEQRVTALVAFYHQGEAQTFLFCQHIWAALAEPRDHRCAVMAQRLGISGTGRVALRRVLDKYLAEADVACAATGDPVTMAEVADFNEYMAAVRAHFDKMDAAIEAVARRYSAILDGRDPDPSGCGEVVPGPWQS